MSFHHRLHGKNTHKKDVVFHYISEGKPLNNQVQGISKLMMDSKINELRGWRWKEFRMIDDLLNTFFPCS